MPDLHKDQADVRMSGCHSLSQAYSNRSSTTSNHAHLRTLPPTSSRFGTWAEAASAYVERSRVPLPRCASLGDQNMQKVAEEEEHKEAQIEI